MSRKDDINKLYQPSKKMDKVRARLFCSDIVLSLLATVSTGPFKRILTIILVVIAFVYMALSIIDDGVLWYTAESARRKNNIQEAFHVRLDKYDTEGYYNNSIEEPDLSYAVNTFESAFFSKEISERMQWKAYVKIIISVIVIFVSCRLIIDDEILLIIAQTVFSAFVIENSISLLLFSQRIKKLYDAAYHELITVGISKYEQRVWLRYFCVEYESVKAHYKIRLDESLFQTLNKPLSEEWNSIEKQIKIIKDEKK